MVQDLLLLKYDFLNTLNFCFIQIKSYFLGNAIAEVGQGTPPTHNIDIFKQYSNPRLPSTAIGSGSKMSGVSKKELFVAIAYTESHF